MIPFVSLLLFSLAFVIAYLFIFGFIWGAGYYPTPRREIENAADLLEIGPGAKIFDLGCGFGKILFYLAERYPFAHFLGVEIDPIKYLWCSLGIKRKGLSGRAKVIRSNLLNVQLSSASGVFIFLSEDTPIMEKLRKKMMAEMRPGARVVSHVHRFRIWEPSAQKGNVRLYLIPARNSISN